MTGSCDILQSSLWQHYHQMDAEACVLQSHHLLQEYQLASKLKVWTWILASMQWSQNRCNHHEIQGELLPVVLQSPVEEDVQRWPHMHFQVENIRRSTLDLFA